MTINIDWHKLIEVQKHLSENNGLTPNTDIVFILILQNGKAQKSQIKFKDFLRIFWAISENTSYKINTLVVQDQEGRILYRHKDITTGKEELPTSSNSTVITNWNTLSRDIKDSYLEILISQIYVHE